MHTQSSSLPNYFITLNCYLSSLSCKEGARGEGAAAVPLLPTLCGSLRPVILGVFTPWELEENQAGSSLPQTPC